MKQELTLQDCAVLAGVTLRSIQRAIKLGKLHATARDGGRRVILREDFIVWEQTREALQQPVTLDVTRPASAPEPEPTSWPNSAIIPTPPQIGPAPHCRPACPGMPCTNVPTPQSGNWAHPDAIKEHLEQNARELVEQFRGKPDAKPEEYDYEI